MGLCFGSINAGTNRTLEMCIENVTRGYIDTYGGYEGQGEYGKRARDHRAVRCQLE